MRQSQGREEERERERERGCIWTVLQLGRSLLTDVGMDVGRCVVVPGHEAAAVDVQDDGPAGGAGGRGVDVNAVPGVGAILKGLVDFDVAAVFLVLGGLEGLEDSHHGGGHIRTP